MSGRSPAGPLIAEHRVIQRMLVVLNRELELMDELGRVNPVLIDTVVDFIRTYADRCHHGKEEDILFSGFAAKNPDVGLTGVMADLVDDHVRGRAMTGRLAEANRRYAAGDETALGAIESSVRELAEFYPAHIEKEERHFFKPCLEYFSAEEKEQMLAAFDQFDRALIHEKYRGIVASLEQATR